MKSSDTVWPWKCGNRVKGIEGTQLEKNKLGSRSGSVEFERNPVEVGQVGSCCVVSVSPGMGQTQ